ncbi:GDP-mannose transporter [Strigomonas culicis]|nr:GDP-mannose transporter [Strigomonas culicis]|eukprot:EPY31864.1 GDP-mannose transporter [Strigomonas culicis]
MEVAKNWIILTLLFASMLLTSMKSLYTMSVPALTVLKNVALVLTALGERYFYDRTFPAAQYGAFALIILGGYLNAKGDPWVSSLGLFWTFLNIASTVSYTLYIKKLTNRFPELGRYGPVFYNNLLSLPFFFFLALSEFVPFGEGVARSETGALVAIIVVTIVSSSMTFCVFWCVAVTSPTSFSVMGAFNKIPTAIIGMFLFAQYPDGLGYVGLGVALAGSCLYTAVTMHAKRKERPVEPPTEDIFVKDGTSTRK